MNVASVCPVEGHFFNYDTTIIGKLANTICHGLYCNLLLARELEWLMSYWRDSIGEQEVPFLI